MKNCAHMPFPMRMRCAVLQSSGAARPIVKKRAALALLRLIRKTPAEQQVRAATGGSQHGAAMRSVGWMRRRPARAGGAMGASAGMQPPGPEEPDGRAGIIQEQNSRNQTSTR